MLCALRFPTGRAGIRESDGYAGVIVATYQIATKSAKLLRGEDDDQTGPGYFQAPQVKLIRGLRAGIDFILGIHGDFRRQTAD